jgi:hypothetical protein
MASYRLRHIGTNIAGMAWANALYPGPHVARLAGVVVLPRPATGRGCRPDIHYSTEGAG